MRRSPAPLTKHRSRTDHVQTPMDYQNLAPGNAGNAPLQALPLQESTPLPTAEDSAQTAMNQRTILSSPSTRNDTIIDFDLLSVGRSAFIVGIGAAVLTLIQILDLAVDWRSLAGFRTAALPLHLLGILNAGFCAVALRTTIGKPLWRQLALVTFLDLFVIMAALAITMGTAEP